MLINGKPFRTIWEKSENEEIICVIDQRLLPWKFQIAELKTLDDFIFAINDMVIRGAPLIGVTAAYGLYIASLNEHNIMGIEDSAMKLIETRPTAVNLRWAIEKMLGCITKDKTLRAIKISLKDMARKLADEDVQKNEQIGKFGVKLIEKISHEKKGEVVNILTHCNAGWLATVDVGTATAPIYEAHSKNIPVHVWVDETRPRNQGSKLTSWELLNQGVPHTIIADNTGGHLMQKGMVDLVLVGSDRTSANGDVANKIGTYLKALAAFDNRVPFYAVMPSSTIDMSIDDGLSNIPIEERNPDEVKFLDGFHDNEIVKLLITPNEAQAINYAFDVTPARLVTGIITEFGICHANIDSIQKLMNKGNSGKIEKS